MTRRLAVLASAALMGAAACGGASSSGGSSTGTPSPVTSADEQRITIPPGGDAAIVEEVPKAPSKYSGGEVSPVVAAPQLALPRWDGKTVRIGDYSGKATLVTFLYADCPDICPAIADKLVQVKRRLGSDGDRLAIVAISVDPENDTPAAVREFLQSHRALSKIDYLIGSRADLEQVWARWGVAARVSPDNPQLIDHSGLIWGVDTKGRRVTFYPATGIGVEEIAADVRVMLGS